MSVRTDSISPAHVLNSGPSPSGEDQASPARRQYIRPALRLDCPPTPKHWDVASKASSDLDVSEEDGYVLSANGEGSTSGVFVPCDPLSAVRRARPGRLRVKSHILHRRRISGITPINPTIAVSASSSSSHLHLPTNHSSQRSISAQLSSSGVLFRDRLPPTPLTPNTDFKNLCNSFGKCDVPPAAKTASPEVPPAFPISPPVSPTSPAVSGTSSSPSSPRQQRPVLHVQTNSPVGTSAPPPTPALTSPSPSTFQFRPSGRLPKRSPLPIWPTEYHPRAVVV